MQIWCYFPYHCLPAFLSWSFLAHLSQRLVSFSYQACPFVVVFVKFSGFFSSNKRIFHSFGDVTITCEGLYSALMAIKQRGFFSMPHLLWHRASFNEGCLGGSVPCTRDAVTTCYTDLGLLQLGLEHPTFCMRHERFNRLPHHHGFFHLLKNNYSNFKQTWHKTSLS